MTENVMGEQVVQDQNPWDWMRKLGSPVYIRSSKDGNTEAGRIMQDFHTKGYNGGDYTIKDFQKRIEKSNATYSHDLYAKWRRDRIEEFKKLYTPQRDRLLGDAEYKNKVPSLWGKASKKADKANGITRD